MKRYGILMAGFFLVLATQSWAGGFGPIKSRVDAGQFYLGGGYMWLSQEFDASSFVDDSLDVDQNIVYAQGGIGFGRGWEAYIRGGYADYSADDPYQFLDDNDSSDDLRPFVGGGIGGPVFIGHNLTVGPFVQVNYYSEYDDSRGGTFASVPGQEKIYFDNALTVDLGVTFEVGSEDAVLYAGPIYTFYDSEVKSVFRANNGVDVKATGDEDLDLDSSFGGFVGINWRLTENLQLSIEGQYQSGAIIGSQLFYAF